MRARLAVLFILLLGVILPAKAIGATSRGYVIVVGVDRFDDGPFAPLDYATRDAVRIASGLVHVGFVEQARVVYLVDDERLESLLYDEDPSVVSDAENILNNEKIRRAKPNRDNLVEALEWLKDRAAEEDQIIIVFATHGGYWVEGADGSTIQSPQMFYALSDTSVDSRGRPQGGITRREVLDYLDAMDPRNKAVIEATCHQKLIQRGSDQPPTGQTVVVAASKRGQSVAEHPDLRGTAFANFLVSGLLGSDELGLLAHTTPADWNHDAILTLYELYRYAAARAWQYTEMVGAAEHAIWSDERILNPPPFILNGEDWYGIHDTELLGELNIEASSLNKAFSFTGEPTFRSLDFEVNGHMVEPEEYVLGPYQSGVIKIPAGRLKIRVFHAPSSTSKTARMIVEDGELVTTEQLVEALQPSSIRWATIGFARFGVGLPLMGVLEAGWVRPVLTSPRQGFSVELGVRGRLASSSGCTSDTTCTATYSPLTASWGGHTEALVQVLRRYPRSRWVTRQALGLHLGPAYITQVYSVDSNGSIDIWSLAAWGGGLHGTLGVRPSTRKKSMNISLGVTAYDLPIQRFAETKLHLMSQVGLEIRSGG